MWVPSILNNTVKQNVDMCRDNVDGLLNYQIGLQRLTRHDSFENNYLDLQHSLLPKLMWSLLLQFDIRLTTKNAMDRRVKSYFQKVLNTF